jgi:glycosyltransferase involved in cell wall biosynthesis
MRLLFVIHDFFPRFYGGAERYVLNLGQQMQRLGHRVTVLTYGLDEPDGSFDGTTGPLLSRSYVFGGIEVVSLRHRQVPPDIQFRVEHPEVAAAVEEAIARRRIDLVHIAHPMRVASAWTAARRRGVPVVMTLTDFWLPCPRGRFFKVDFSPCSSPDGGRKCIRECLVPAAATGRYEEALAMFAGVDALVAPSRFLAGVFERCGWKRPIACIPHGVDYRYVRPLPRPERPGGKVRFGYIGVLKKFKGIDLLLRSFKAVERDNVELVLYGTLAGDELFRPELEALVAADPRVRLLGRYDHEDLPAVMAGIDVMMVPSTTLDSYGLVLVESLAYGVPVIASDMVGAAYEHLRDGKNGFVFPVERPERLRELIDAIAADPAVVGRLCAGITLPPRIEEEAFMVESIYTRLLAGAAV